MIWGSVKMTWKSSITWKSATLFDLWAHNLDDLRIFKLYSKAYVIDDLRVYDVDYLRVVEFTSKFTILSTW